MTFHPRYKETSAPDDGGTTKVPKADKHSYPEILRSSAMIGASSVLVVGIGVIRTKAMAVMLGTAGLGLMSIFSSISDLAVAIAGLGINSSGVRQIAEAAASNDGRRMALTATVLRRIAVLLGLFGAGLLALFSQTISELTFGNDQHAGDVRMLSLAVFLLLVAGGQAALIQGTRRIGDLAKMGVLGALLGTAISVPVIYVFRADGVVISLVCAAAMPVATAWWYGRKVKLERHSIRLPEFRREVASLLKLGLAFMASGFLVLGAAYVVRSIIVRNIGLEAAGLYSAAWTLGGLYVGFVLQAMGADFYPRLVGVAEDNRQCNRLVNEQAQVSLLLAGPGIIATLTLAPLVVAALYSTQFVGAVDTLRWICLGMALRVVAWPMGFIIVAKNQQLLFFGADLAWAIVNVSLAFVLVDRFGVVGTGMAFFASYVSHGCLVYAIVRGLSGFRWGPENRNTGILFASTIAIAFCGFNLLPPLWSTLVGILASVLSGLYSLHSLLTLVSAGHSPLRIRRLLGWLRLEASSSRGR